jgi:hypothetical protein
MDEIGLLWAFVGTSCPTAMENPISTSESPVLIWMSVWARAARLECLIGRATMREENKTDEIRIDFILG